MEVGTLLPVLALTTLCIVAGAAFVAKRSIDRRKNANPDKSTLASDMPDRQKDRA